MELAFLLVLMLLNVGTSTSISIIYNHHFCPSNNYFNNTNYKKNVNLALFSLENNIENTFYNSTAGTNGDKCNAAAFCRGDINLDFCQLCVKNAIRRLQSLCPTSEESIIYFSVCMVRYTRKVVNGTLDARYANVASTDGIKIMDPKSYYQEVRVLFDNLTHSIAEDRSGGEFATGMHTGNFFWTIYGLVQCSPELNKQQCISCLEVAATIIPVVLKDWDTKSAVVSFYPQCIFQYATNKFYNESIVGLSPGLPSGNRGNNSLKIIIPACVVISLILVFVAIFIYKRNQKKKNNTTNKISLELRNPKVPRYDYDTVRNATNNFSIDNKIGEGGFGIVYKGVIDNKVVAIKKALRLSPRNEKEFKKEIILFGGVRHANLLELLGYCIAEDVRILIFEFMPNGDLDDFLFGPRNVDVYKRIELIRDIASGLNYLHNDSKVRIVHRDIKLKNILLDSKFTAKIADFGLAREIPGSLTHIDTSCAGTIGYIAFEHCYGTLNEKFDVYSFGIVALEILTGTKRHSHRGDLDFVDYVEKMLKEGTFLNAMKEEHRPVSDPGNKVQRCLQIALACASFNQERRPTMKLVLSMLDGAPLELPNPPVLTSSSFSGSSAGLTSGSSSTTQYFSTYYSM